MVVGKRHIINTISYQVLVALKDGVKKVLIAFVEADRVLLPVGVHHLVALRRLVRGLVDLQDLAASLGLLGVRLPLGDRGVLRSGFFRVSCLSLSLYDVS